MGDGYIWVEMKGHREEEGWISDNFESLRNVGVLSEGSLHVCGGALHITAVVRGILARAIALSNCSNRIQFNVIQVQVTILYLYSVFTWCFVMPGAPIECTKLKCDALKYLRGSSRSRLERLLLHSMPQTSSGRGEIWEACLWSGGREVLCQV